MQHVSEVLSVGVESQSGQAEIDVQHVAVADHIVQVGGGRFLGTKMPAVSVDDANVWMEPGCVVQLLQLFSEPPFHVLWCFLSCLQQRREDFSERVHLQLS